ncbi:hypothetical protein [Streptomyces sp. NPDC060322]|uniref:hypothetical protein n=1 Tax=Streptomyces sp. NPDC060322 TaxID=3347097 RepID=UPI0036643840
MRDEGHQQAVGLAVRRRHEALASLFYGNAVDPRDDATRIGFPFLDLHGDRH